MNTKLCTLVLSLCLSMRCDAQESKPSAQMSALFAEFRKGAQEQQKLREFAVASDKSVAALRADLATPWTSLIIALRHDDSLNGTSFRGFRLGREGESVTVAPWIETRGKEQTGESRQLTKPEVERLLSETTLYYLAASLSEAPIEKVGPKPGDPDKAYEWNRRYRAAGGMQANRLAETNDYGIDVRIATAGGLKRHGNMWGNHCPDVFYDWIDAFGTLPRQ